MVHGVGGMLRNKINQLIVEACEWWSWLRAPRELAVLRSLDGSNRRAFQAPMKVHWQSGVVGKPDLE